MLSSVVRDWLAWRPWWPWVWVIAPLPPSAHGPDGPRLALWFDSQVGKGAQRQESAGTQEQPDGWCCSARWRHHWVLGGGVNPGICCPRDVVSPHRPFLPGSAWVKLYKKCSWAGQDVWFVLEEHKVCCFSSLWVTLSSFCLLRVLTTLCHFHG